MTEQELEEFNAPIKGQSPLGVSDLANKSDRTLLFGYTTNRNSFHVYLKDGAITRLVYDGLSPITLVKKTAVFWDDTSLLIPDKRIYPAASDLEFCRLLRIRGFLLPFTKYEERPHFQFYGRVIDADGQEIVTQ